MKNYAVSETVRRRPLLRERLPVTVFVFDVMYDAKLSNFSSVFRVAIVDYDIFDIYHKISYVTWPLSLALCVWHSAFESS